MGSWTTWRTGWELGEVEEVLPTINRDEGRRRSSWGFALMNCPTLSRVQDFGASVHWSAGSSTGSVR